MLRPFNAAIVPVLCALGFIACSWNENYGEAPEEPGGGLPFSKVGLRTNRNSIVRTVVEACQISDFC